MSYVYVSLDPKNSNQTSRIKLEFNDANISSITVDNLKERLAADRPELPANYHLTFFGRVLKSTNQLSNYGIKTGALLFVLPSEPAPSEASKNKKPKFEPQELPKMMAAILTALRNPSFRTMLSKVYDRDYRDNLIACTPGLRENIVAFAILQDPDLMMMLCTESDSLAKIAEKYSVFAEAAVQLAAAFHEEMIASSMQSNTANDRVLENSYSLQNYESDDDDLEGGVDAAPPAGQAVRETQPIIQNRITSDMVQRAIQEAARADPLPSTSRQANAQPSSSSNAAFGSSSLTTASNPLASNLASSLASNSGASSSNAPSQVRRSSRDWTQQLATMRELGLFNDAVCIQALEACNGNVQEAINLYFVLNNQGD